jgi:AraC-like DNA-binding protein
MKPKLELLAQSSQQHVFLCYELVVPEFAFNWHYHPAYELTYIVSGKGKRMVGDSYEPFSVGDIVLLGPNVPHTWASEKETVPGQPCRAVVIQFSGDLILPILALSDSASLNTLLKNASTGLHFPIQNGGEIQLLFERICLRSGIPMFANLLLLLNALSEAKAIPLASSYYQPVINEQNAQRINVVFNYIEEHFETDISIQEAARRVHLSESAFCKFFKRSCRKTFSDYVNDLRVAQASRLLVETDQPISQIAATCGFENLSYFNRVFLKKKGVAPRQLRRGDAK